MEVESRTTTDNARVSQHFSPGDRRFHKSLDGSGLQSVIGQQLADPYEDAVLRLADRTRRHLQCRRHILDRLIAHGEPLECEPGTRFEFGANQLHSTPCQRCTRVVARRFAVVGKRFGKLGELLLAVCSAGGEGVALATTSIGPHRVPRNRPEPAAERSARLVAAELVDAAGDAGEDILRDVSRVVILKSALSCPAVGQRAVESYELFPRQWVMLADASDQRGRCAPDIFDGWHREMEWPVPTGGAPAISETRMDSTERRAARSSLLRRLRRRNCDERLEVAEPAVEPHDHKPATPRERRT